MRWFTLGGEIDFCGHATLGTSFVILNYCEKDQSEVTFVTQVGKLTVKRKDDVFEMDFPAYSTQKIEVTDQMEYAIGVRPLEAYIDTDLLLVLPDAISVKELQLDQSKMKDLEGLLVAVTAPADQDDYDCVSNREIYNKALKLHGEVGYEDCYCFVPIIPVGGKKIENLQKGKAFTHI